MSVQDVRELFLDRPGKKDASTTEVTRAFQVDTDSPEDTSLTVMADSRIPQRGDTHPTETTLWVVDVVADPDTDWATWNVRVRYGLKPPQTPQTQGRDPWDLDPVISFGEMLKERVLEKCYAIGGMISGPTRGIPQERITNSARQPFDPPVMIDDFLPVITIQFALKHSDFNPDDIYTYLNTINNDMVTIAGIVIPQACAICKDYKATKKWTEKNEAYWDIQIEIVINHDTWFKNIVDVGFNEGAEVGGKWVLTPIKDVEGKRISEPALLDGAGKELGPGVKPVYMELHAYWEQDWTGFLPEDY